MGASLKLEIEPVKNHNLFATAKGYVHMPPHPTHLIALSVIGSEIDTNCSSMHLR